MKHLPETNAPFYWTALARNLEQPPGAINIASLALTLLAHSDRPALCCRGPGRERQALSYTALHDLSSRFAGLLEQLGVGRGAVVASLAGSIPEVYLAALGSWWGGAIFCPLFATLGPLPLHHRLKASEAAVLVTSRRLYRERVAACRADLPALRHILLIDDGGAPLEECLSLNAALASAPRIAPALTTSRDGATLHFTSGTTGMPKGALLGHGSALNLWASGRDVLGFRGGETYWCTADPGWVTGTAYGIIAPLLHGLTVVAESEAFDVQRWYRTLAEEKVAILYTSPSALRRLMRAGGSPRQCHDLARLRLIFSVGEPLNPEVIRWSREALGLPVHDTWWQTETGAIAIANTPARPIRPGSMGLPVPGMTAAVVRHRPGGGIDPIETHGTLGEIALRPPWPSMFLGYWNDPAGTAACFADGWYLTGDLASRDADGYFWFAGRADDIIKTAGHQVSPFEVESALLEHPAVAEAAAIGLPDATIGSRVAAYVTLRRGWRPAEPLRQELLGFGRQRLGPAAAPREIHFRARLPRNRAGKILRRRIRESAIKGAP